MGEANLETDHWSRGGKTKGGGGGDRGKKMARNRCVDKEYSGKSVIVGEAGPQKVSKFTRKKEVQTKDGK